MYDSQNSKLHFISKVKKSKKYALNCIVIPVIKEKKNYAKFQIKKILKDNKNKGVACHDSL